MNWFSIIHDPETGTAHVRLHDDIGCGGRPSCDLERELTAFIPKKVELWIDSSGGNSITGLNLFQIFRRYPVEVTIAGKCYSSALIAAMAGQTIRIFPGSRILVHSPSGCCHGTADELFDAAIEVEQLRRSFATILCERTRQPAPVVCVWLARDTWLTAAEAVAVGLADEVVELPPPPAASCAPKTASNLPALTMITNEEKMFADWLFAFGRIRVGSREKFMRQLFDWSHSNIYETDPE